jgi:acyl-coenzyme A thioesterase PaaI-like protein
MTTPPADRTAALASLADELRALVRLAVNVDAPTDVLRDAIRGLAEVRGRLASHEADPPLSRYPARHDELATANDLMPFDPVLGVLSPLAPPVLFVREEDKVVGRVTYTKPYEGPPGCVHGGIIALAFDQVLSLANLMRGVAGPTAQLRLRFRRPTPLGTPLRYEGWSERVVGRRLHAAGRLLAGDQVTVEAEGTFVELSSDRVMRMLDP